MAEYSPATIDQISNDSTLPDHWEKTTLSPSTGRLYQLDFECSDGSIVGQSSYFVDEETYNKYLRDDDTFDIVQYCNDAQIPPHIDGTYKNHITAYEIPEDISAETSIAEANTSFGTGGARQYFVDRDQLTPVEDFESPTIRDDERMIGEDNAMEMLDNGRSAHDEYMRTHENDLSEGNSSDEMKSLGNKDDEIAASPTDNTNETMKDVANQEALPPAQEGNSLGNGLSEGNSPDEMKSLGNEADEIAASPTDNTNETMKDVANQEALPSAQEENSLDNGYQQNNDNAMDMGS